MIQFRWRFGVITAGSKAVKYLWESLKSFSTISTCPTLWSVGTNCLAQHRSLAYRPHSRDRPRPHPVLAARQKRTLPHLLRRHHNSNSRLHLRIWKIEVGSTVSTRLDDWKSFLSFSCPFSSSSSSSASSLLLTKSLLRPRSSFPRFCFITHLPPNYFSKKSLLIIYWLEFDKINQTCRSDSKFKLLPFFVQFSIKIRYVVDSKDKTAMILSLIPNCHFHLKKKTNEPFVELSVARVYGNLMY